MKKRDHSDDDDFFSRDFIRPGLVPFGSLCRISPLLLKSTLCKSAVGLATTDAMIRVEGRDDMSSV